MLAQLLNQDFLIDAAVDTQRELEGPSMTARYIDEHGSTHHTEELRA
jgi:hypothetical protein